MLYLQADLPHQCSHSYSTALLHAHLSYMPRQLKLSHTDNGGEQQVLGLRVSSAQGRDTEVMREHLQIIQLTIAEIS